ncbi:transport protein Trs120 or TRAPPC9 TRAPP II complex subunit-domain-containing protein [Chytridium lagenaria]|nr:transport protein Trs120 or TRAPPC9 TRAPP II complex subunit-domain-containing protein [Chytridium lagenaria]
MHENMVCEFMVHFSTHPSCADPHPGVPVHPLKRDTFRRYVDLISQFCVVSVADLSPPAGVSSSSSKTEYTGSISLCIEFLENLPQADGQMLFNFVTSYQREHSPLEEFQPHRQIMGPIQVIGIVNCRETSSLADSAKKFQQIVQRYPPILASRCFAFEPTLGKDEETKGLVTIPNEGQLSYYLSSIMNEFALDLLVAFELWFDIYQAQHIERRPLIQGPLMTLGVVNPITATQPTSSTSPGVTAPPNAALAGGGTTTSLASTYMPSTTQESSVFGQFGSMLAPDKNRKRTPARSQKLIGDLYLMAGRLDIAMANFLSAIEAMKQNSDHYWHASTLESYYAALVLALINKAGVGKSFCFTSEVLLADRKPQIFAPSWRLKHALLSQNCALGSEVSFWWHYYRWCQWAAERIVINGGVGVTKADISSWLARARSFSHFEYLTLSDQVWITTTMASIFSSIGYKRKHAFYLRQTALLVLSTLRFSREGSRSPTRLYLGNLERTSEVGSMELYSEHDSVTGKVDGGISRSRTNGALECMKRVCEVMGIALKAPKPATDTKSVFAPLSDDEEDWLDDFDKDDDLHSETTMLPSSPAHANALSPSPSVVSLFRQRVRIPRLRFGWPTLQIDVLKECIEIAQAVEDFSSTILFSTRLLRRMNRHMGREEQLELSEILQSVVLRTRAATAEVQQPPLPQLTISATEKKNSLIDNIPMPVMARGVMGGVAGVPVIRKLALSGSQLEKFQFSVNEAKLDVTLKSVAQKDLFIYNPYAQPTAGRGKSKEEKVTLIANEPAYFNVTLANPFAFDLEIHSIVLSTTEIDFDAIPFTTVIPAEARSHVIRLSGIPRSTGTLHVHGCVVRLFGGCVEEIIQPVQKALDDPKRRTKDGRRKRQEERERFGKKPQLYYLTKVQSQSHRNRHPVELENIGNVLVNFLRVSFLETYSSDVPLPPADGVEEPEKGSVMKLGPAVPELLPVDLKPGGKVNFGLAFLASAGVQTALQASNIDVIIAGLRAGTDAAMASTDGSLAQSRDEEIPIDRAPDLDQTMKNVWTHPFEALFELYDNPDSTIPSMVSKFLINPGMTKRVGIGPFLVMLPLRRVDLPEEVIGRPIPTPQWRQFVVGRTVKMSSSEEFSRKLAFWLKEILLGGLDVGNFIEDPRHPAMLTEEERNLNILRWRKGRVLARWGFGRGRWGVMDSLRELRLESSMVDVVTVEKVSFSVDVWAFEASGDIKNEDGAEELEPVVSRISQSRFKVKYREFVNITWTLKTQPDTFEDSTLILRIQPVQELGGGQLELVDPVALQRLIYTGSLQVPLRLESNGVKPESASSPDSPTPEITQPSHTVPTMFLARGVYRFLYHTERVPSPSALSDASSLGVRKVVWGSEEVVVEVE